MISIREHWIALDANEFLFAIDPPAGHKACHEIVFQRLYGLYRDLCAGPSD